VQDALNVAGPASQLRDAAWSRLRLGQVEKACELFSAAQATGADADECSGGRWFCHMFRGNFEQAWRESDAIARRGAPDPNRLWSGRSLRGQRVVVRCLHGLGDAIQFIRFVDPLSKIAAAVYVEVPGCLMRLFRSLPQVKRVISWDVPDEKYLQWDEQVEIMELPRIFRVSNTALPNVVPYLFAPSKHKDRLPGDPLEVGLAWASSTWDNSRSIPLPELLPILSDPRLHICSLQTPSRCPGIEEIPRTLRPWQIIGDTDDALDTASLIQSLDLVITIDTMVAHLAGALGKSVWLMLTRPSDWRWMLDRDDSPWYPTMKIFRQATMGDWVEVVGRVQEQLQALVARSHTAQNGRRSRSAGNGIWSPNE
jgi:hypothetical protein